MKKFAWFLKCYYLKLKEIIFEQIFDTLLAFFRRGWLYIYIRLLTKFYFVQCLDRRFYGFLV